MTKNNVVTKRSKHIDIRFHYVRDTILRGILDVQRIPSEEMTADGLTKPLKREKLEKFLYLAGIN